MGRVVSFPVSTLLLEKLGTPFSAHFYPTLHHNARKAGDSSLEKNWQPTFVSSKGGGGGGRF